MKGKNIPISSKNQITIPKKWTESLNIKGKVNISVEGNKIVITPLNIENI